MKLLFVILGVISFFIIKAEAQMDIKIELNENEDSYRVIVYSKSQIDLSDLQIPTSGLSPRGISIQIKDSGDRVIPLYGREWYSSASMSSDDPFVKAEYFQLQDNDSFKSDWFRIGNLFRGIDKCIDGSEANIIFRIMVSVKTKNGPILSSVSSWIVSKNENILTPTAPSDSAPAQTPETKEE
jgi:hypothetical protein